MQRHGWRMVMGLLVMIGLGGAAQAQDRYVGEMCWRMDPFVDTVLLDVIEHNTAADGLQQFFSFTYEWRGVSGGTIFYLLPGGGSATAGLGTIALDLYGLQATLHNTSMAAFRGNRVCDFSAILSGDPLEGPWTMVCRGSSATPPDQFIGSGTMLPIPCAPLSSAEEGGDFRVGQVGGRLAGY